MPKTVNVNYVAYIVVVLQAQCSIHPMGLNPFICQFVLSENNLPRRDKKKEIFPLALHYFDRVILSSLHYNFIVHVLLWLWDFESNLSPLLYLP